MSTKRKTAEAPASVETFSFRYEAAVGVVRMVAGIMTELEARHLAQALTHWGFTGVTIKREPFIPALMVADASPRLTELTEALTPTLTETQTKVLATLMDRGRWPGGWKWDTESGTRRILDALVRKGRVTVTDGIYRPVEA